MRKILLLLSLIALPSYAENVLYIGKMEGKSVVSFDAKLPRMHDVNLEIEDCRGTIVNEKRIEWETCHAYDYSAITKVADGIYMTLITPQGYDKSRQQGAWQFIMDLALDERFRRERN